MTRLLALTKRELMAHFFAPVPYLVLFFFLLITGFFFQSLVQEDRTYLSYQYFFDALVFILMFLVPLLTMTSVADERSRNTLETLLTAPVTEWQVILSKWLGTFSFYVVMLAPTLVYLAILVHLGAEVGKPDLQSVAAAYLGALLLGGMYLAIGIFASSVTENALLSAFVAFFLILALWILAGIPQIGGAGPDWMRKTVKYLGPQEHFAEFLKGRLALHDVLYFVTMTVFFQFLAVRAIESRKWR